jgi:hypothetical protein
VLRHLGTGTSTWSVPDPNVPVEDLVGVMYGTSSILALI